MIFEICEGERLLFSKECGEIKRALSGEDKFFESDFDNMFEYYRKGEISRADVLDILSADIIDAEFSQNVFWLMKIMTDYGVIKKISPNNRMKIVTKVIPAITAVIRSEELKTQRVEKIRRFSLTMSEEMKRAANGECTADEAAEKIISVLPDEHSAAEELSKRPDFIDLINMAEAFAGSCASPVYAETIREYKERILDNGKK